MNDYKEICETLRLANSWQFAPGYVEAMLKAADAIEQLVADNESYKCAFADLHNEIANYCEMIDTLEKERDAAVDDLEQLMHTYSGTVCFYCKHYNDRHCDDCVLGDKWQWRGVQEVDDG